MCVCSLCQRQGPETEDRKDERHRNQTDRLGERERERAREQKMEREEATAEREQEAAPISRVGAAPRARALMELSQYSTELAGGRT